MKAGVVTQGSSGPLGATVPGTYDRSPRTNGFVERMTDYNFERTRQGVPHRWPRSLEDRVSGKYET